ncbi:Mth938-like domain-containing protein [Pleomorphomonas sp. JP5]|uniref:Mth938-like domain-containing protein n=1 Tax=Pleomorphomonas sp. JP5 TaxID=2942998 RepID=UPI002043099B|nr:MTH938/NDUFAF3 family protein [Pleomorphomonas sp. JP5]MCM5556173.1 MTH938/NDUFAF3 family protein [Pleomorphomonas sp. JP5]
MKLFGPRGRALERRQQHLPEQVPVDAYGNGGFRFGGMSHRGSILILPSGVHGWSAVAPADITLDSLAQVFEEAADLDMLLVGTGLDLVPVPRNLVEAMREHGVKHEAMSTGAAVRLFNVMLGERRRFAAALLAVD